MKNKLLKIFSAILVTFLFIGNVNAITIADAGDNVTQEGEYNSVRFVAGNTVTNKAKIDGLSFAAGNTIFGFGDLSYGFYAGNVLNLNDKVEKDLFVAGNNITIGPEAVIGRDLFVAGSTIIINSNIGRDLRAGAEYVSLKGITINGDAYIDASNIELDEKTVITGKLSYPSTASVSNVDKASIGSIEVKEVKEVNTDEIVKSFESTMFIYSLLAGIVTIIILLAVLPGLRDKLNKVKLDGKEMLSSALQGILVLIVVPVVSLFTILTGLLTPLTLIVLAIYFICLYLAPLFVAYYIGYIINTKLFKLKNAHLILSSILGITVLKLVCLIPVVGGLIKFIALVYGLGLIYMLIKTNISKK